MEKDRVKTTLAVNSLQLGSGNEFHSSSHPRPRVPFLRASIEIGFIVFLFYSNLLMGEFSRSTVHGKTLAFALRDIFTATNFAISVTAAMIGYLIVEFLRRKL